MSQSTVIVRHPQKMNALVNGALGPAMRSTIKGGSDGPGTGSSAPEEVADGCFKLPSEQCDTPPPHD